MFPKSNKMIQGGLYENPNHLFKVDYYKKGKPQGKRGNETYSDSFLDVLYDFLLNVRRATFIADSNAFQVTVF